MSSLLNAARVCVIISSRREKKNLLADRCKLWGIFSFLRFLDYFAYFFIGLFWCKRYHIQFEHSNAMNAWKWLVCQHEAYRYTRDGGTYVENFEIVLVLHSFHRYDIHFYIFLFHFFVFRFLRLFGWVARASQLLRLPSIPKQIHCDIAFIYCICTLFSFVRFLLFSVCSFVCFSNAFVNMHLDVAYANGDV